MPTHLPLPPAHLAPVPPTRKRWTTAEFHHVGDGGLFEGRQPTLIDGEILEQGQMTPRDATALTLVFDVFRGTFGPGWWVRTQFPLPLGPYTDPVPDGAIVHGFPRDFRDHQMTAALVVEIADLSLEHDTTVKSRVYATAGIPDDWVLDLNAGQLIVFRDPTADGYRLRATFGPEDHVAPLAAPAVSILVADLLL